MRWKAARLGLFCNAVVRASANPDTLVTETQLRVNIKVLALVQQWIWGAGSRVTTVEQLCRPVRTLPSWSQPYPFTCSLSQSKVLLSFPEGSHWWGLKCSLHTCTTTGLEKQAVPATCATAEGNTEELQAGCSLLASHIGCFPKATMVRESQGRRAAGLSQACGGWKEKARSKCRYYSFF